MSARAIADDSVPVSLQIRILGRLVYHEQNFEERTGGTVSVLVMRNGGSDESIYEANALARQFRELGSIRGRPVSVRIVEWTTDKAFIDKCAFELVTIAYFTSGFKGRVPVAPGVLTLGVNESLAWRGAVIGFVLEQARPVIVLNLPRSRHNGLDFEFRIFKLVKIIP